VDAPDARQRKGRADHRVAGEGQLALRCEDAHAAERLRVAGGDDEGRFGVVHLPRDRLHLVRFELLGVRKDGELIAAEGRIRKDIQLDEAEASHTILLLRSGRPGLPLWGHLSPSAPRGASPPAFGERQPCEPISHPKA